MSKKRATAIFDLSLRVRPFRLVSLNTTRQLTAQDEKAVNTLREACAVEEWEHGGSEFRPTAMAVKVRCYSASPVFTFAPFLDVRRRIRAEARRRSSHPVGNICRSHMLPS